MNICIYIYIRSVCRQQLFRSLKAHQYSSDQKKILRDQSTQTNARVVSISYRLCLPFSINRELNLRKLRNVILRYIYIHIYITYIIVIYIIYVYYIYIYIYVYILYMHINVYQLKGFPLTISLRYATTICT